MDIAYAEHQRLANQHSLLDSLFWEIQNLVFAKTLKQHFATRLGSVHGWRWRTPSDAA
jgi:hypothetical protein